MGSLHRSKEMEFPDRKESWASEFKRQFDGLTLWDEGTEDEQIATIALANWLVDALGVAAAAKDHKHKDGTVDREILFYDDSRLEVFNLRQRRGRATLIAWDPIR